VTCGQTSRSWRFIWVRVRPAVSFELATDQTAKLVDAFEAELLGEIVVGDEFTRTFTCLTVMSNVAALPLSCSAG
jgi:hypothetical protein